MRYLVIFEDEHEVELKEEGMEVEVVATVESEEEEEEVVMVLDMIEVVEAVVTTELGVSDGEAPTKLAIMPPMPTDVWILS